MSDSDSEAEADDKNDATAPSPPPPQVGKRLIDIKSKLPYSTQAFHNSLIAISNSRISSILSFTL